MYKKKSLGQHFLHNPHYLGMLADAADIQKGDAVVEIGPGEGALTKVLLERGAHVVAVEKDTRLIPLLSEKFAQEIKNKQLIVVEEDALEFDVPKHLTNKKSAYTVVGNIPYYITGSLLRKYLTDEVQPGTLVFLIQKEVAERIARSTKESLLSLSIKAYGTPTYIKTVPRGAFNPPPAVDSAILLVSDISRKNFKNKKHEEQFFTLLHAGFAQKRKLLKRNVEKILGSDTEKALQDAGIPLNARAEDVSLAQWLALTLN
jgi:16S rRNA (adenine1518-N6/adenine1519-N6)-dimethyltransferase